MIYLVKVFVIRFDDVQIPDQIHSQIKKMYQNLHRILSTVKDYPTRIFIKFRPIYILILRTHHFHPIYKVSNYIFFSTNHRLLRMSIDFSWSILTLDVLYNIYPFPIQQENLLIYYINRSQIKAYKEIYNNKQYFIEQLFHKDENRSNYTRYNFKLCVSKSIILNRWLNGLFLQQQEIDLCIFSKVIQILRR